jgi:hypothetical protein
MEMGEYFKQHIRKKTIRFYDSSYIFFIDTYQFSNTLLIYYLIIDIGHLQYRSETL